MTKVNTHFGEKFQFFAYGSLMGTARLQQRGIVPHTSIQAQLRGYRMTFDLALPLIGLPLGMATLEPDSDATVYGVLHTLPFNAQRILDFWEGTFFGLYIRKNVLVYLNSGDICWATTYIGRSTKRGIPKTSYMYRLLEGAHEFNLPCHWIEWLKEFSVK